MGETQKLVRFGLYHLRSVTHVGTVHPAPGLPESFALFTSLCGRMRDLVWDRAELENSARLAIQPCKACESKASALRGEREG
jgi:hypothetical protein